MECPISLSIEPAENNEYFCDNLYVDDGTVMRRHSMPPSPFRLSLSSNDVRNSEALRRVRSFKTTSKGVVNSGDVFRKKGSVCLNVSSGLAVTSSDIDLATAKSRVRLPSNTSQGSSYASSGAPSYFRVLVMGCTGVGKTALIKQFISSETNVADEPNGPDCSESDCTVSIMLDDEESLLEFCNFPDKQFPEEDINVDAYMIVFSITDTSTYKYALELLRYLRNVLCTDRTIFVVANKTDLVRKRTVERNDARISASFYNCKYVETSASLSHHVDNLLTGLVSQIRLRLNPDKLLEQAERTCDNCLKSRHGSLKTAKEVLQKLFNHQKSLSCDDLYVL